MPVHSSIKYKVASIKRLILTTYYKLLATRRSKTKLYVGLGILLLIAPVALISLFKPQSGAAAWWNKDWSFRVSYPVANSTGETQTDFQVQLTVDTAALIAAGKLQADCADLRVTNYSGKTLGHWVEPNTCDTDSTLVWTKVDRVPTDGTQVYVYYGNPSAPSDSSTEKTFIRDIESAVAAWPLDDSEETQSYSRAVHPSVDEGRNLMIDGDMEDADTSAWTITAGAVLSKQTNNPHGGNQVMRVEWGSSISTAAQAILTVGKTYRVTGYMRSDGTATAVVRHLSTNLATTTSTSWQEVDVTFVATETLIRLGNSSSTASYVEFDDVSVKQVNIPASGGQALNLLTDGDMEAADTSAWTAGGSSNLSKETTSPHGGTQVLRITATGGANPNAAQNILSDNYYRVYGYARSDGNVAPKIYLGSTLAWTGTTSTAWQPFDVIAKPTSGATAFYLLQQSSVNGQYVEFDSVVVTQDTTIRPGELLQDGDMEESGTGVWTANSLAVITKESTSPHGGVQVLRIGYGGQINPSARQSSVLVVGKMYRATGFARSDGNTVPYINDGVTQRWSGTTSTSWQAFDFTFVPAGTNFTLQSIYSGNGYVEFDDVSVVEVSPLSGRPTNGVVLNEDSGGHLSKAYTFDGTNDLVNIYSSDLNSVFNPDEGTLVAWAKVSDAGVWEDGVNRRIAFLRTQAGDDYIYLAKQTTNNTIRAYVLMGDTQINIDTTDAGGSTDWFKLSLSWSKTSDEVKLFLNGSQVSSTKTGLGNWVGNFRPSGTVIGASDTDGSNPWSGQINDVRLYDRALSPSEIADQYSEDYDTQNYYTENYQGRELIRKYDTGVTVGSVTTEEEADGPVAYWAFDEGYGTTTNDQTSNSNDGTISGATWQTEDMCVSGKCLYFDGADDSISVANTVSKTQTFSFWVRPISDTETIAKLGTNAEITIDEGTITLGSEFTNATVYINGVASYSLPSTSYWSHVTITFDEITADDINLGTDGTTYLHGFLDEVKIYPYARTADQIKQDYVSGATVLGGGSQKWMSDGLVGYWKMDEASWTNNCSTASVIDSSGNGNNGKSCPNSTGPTGGAAGKFGNSGSFDGTDDYVSTGDIDYSPDNKITVSAWVKLTSCSSSNGMCYVISKHRFTGESPYTLAVTTGGKVAFHVMSSTNYSVSASTINDGNWHLVTGVLDGTTSHIYIDGNLEDTTTDGFTPSNNNNALVIGGSDVNSSYRPFDGEIDETRIYNRALSPAEVKALYQWAPGPVGYWDFDEGSGTSAFDKSGNGNNGTFNSDPNWVQGKLGSALDFDSNDSVDVGLLGDFGSQFGRSTITFWGKWTITTDSKPYGTHNSYNDYFAEPRANWNSNDMRIYIRDSDGKQLASNSGDHNANDGEWHHWSIVVDSAQNILDIYIDGIKRNVGTSGNESPSVFHNLTKSWYIGKFNGPSATPFEGEIDEFKIYNYPRTQSQILQDMQGRSSSVVGVSAVGGGGTLPDPIAHYKFDEGSGQTAHNSAIGGSSLDGTLGADTNSGTDDPSWQSDCKVNGCLSFDGTTDLVETVDSPFDSIGTKEHSIFAWVNVNSHKLQPIVIKGAYRPGLKLNSSGKVTYANTTTNEALVSNTSISTGNWHHVGYTLSGSTVKIYINGKEDKSGTVTVGDFNNTNKLSIGGNPPDDQMYDGLIDEVKIYNTALTEAQVLADYNANAGINFGTGGDDEADYVIDGAGDPPVGYWSFDEKQGSTAGDSSGNENNGTISGASWVRGKVNNALSFDGVDDYVSIPDAESLDFDTGSFTITTWIKTDTLMTGNSTYRLLFKNEGGLPSAGWSIYVQGTSASGQYGRIQLSDGTNQITESPSGGISLVDGNWHQLSVVINRSSNTAIFYVDGKAQTTSVNIAAVTGSISNDANVFIGKYPISNIQYFPGLIDEVKIYDYARTPAQIAYDYNRGAPIAHWKFDECTGTTAYDSSGNGNNGTITIGASGEDTVGNCETSSTSWGNGADGKWNSSLSFDGVDDYVASGFTSTYTTSSSFTWSAWIKTTNSNQCFIGSVREAGVNDPSVNMCIGSGGGTTEDDDKLRIFIRDDSGNNSGTNPGLYGSTVLTDNNWHHVLLVRNTTNDTIQIYVDGKEENSIADTTDTITLTGENIFIGAQNVRGTAGNFFDGLIDDVRIYNYALSEDQIKNVYNGGAAILFSE